MKRAVKGIQPAGPYSPGIVASGTFLFVSSQIGRRGGGIVEGGIVEETRQALENLGVALREAGTDFRHVVRCGVFLADLGDVAAMNEVYAQFFPEPRPARTTVGAILAGAKIAIDAIAVVPVSEGI